jgi:hypothetical protein
MIMLADLLSRLVVAVGASGRLAPVADSVYVMRDSRSVCVYVMVRLLSASGCC